MELFFKNYLLNKISFIHIIGIFILLNIIFKLFSFFIFFIIKSLFPIIYVGGMLNIMDNYSDQKPISNLITNIKKNYKKEVELEDCIQKTIKKNKKQVKSNHYYDIPEIKILQ
jgi:hypothetical protein